jgi:hypothetical protein
MTGVRIYDPANSITYRHCDPVTGRVVADAAATVRPSTNGTTVRTGDTR